MSLPQVDVAIIGGSGLYELAGVESQEEVVVKTPFGDPSSSFRVGRLAGRTVAFLARHGSGHRLLPTEINYRANLFAIKMLDAQWVLSASAVGSLKEELAPRDVVTIDQFVDRTRHRPSTFFGDGLVAHVSLADPICSVLRESLYQHAQTHAPRAHDGGAYLCMEGPAFSTRAESELYRSWGMDVIGMTNLQEAKLAREAELCYASLALVTDYDCWHEEEEDVTVDAVLAVLRDNATVAAKVITDTVAALPKDRGNADCGCADALAYALITRPDVVDRATRQRLEPVIGRYLPVEEAP